MTSSPHKHEEGDERVPRMMLPQSAIILTILQTIIIREQKRNQFKKLLYRHHNHLREGMLHERLFPLRKILVYLFRAAEIGAKGYDRNKENNVHINSMF